MIDTIYFTFMDRIAAAQGDGEALRKIADDLNILPRDQDHQSVAEVLARALSSAEAEANTGA